MEVRELTLLLQMTCPKEVLLAPVLEKTFQMQLAAWNLMKFHLTTSLLSNRQKKLMWMHTIKLLCPQLHPAAHLVIIYYCHVVKHVNICFFLLDMDISNAEEFEDVNRSSRADFVISQGSATATSNVVGNDVSNATGCVELNEIPLYNQLAIQETEETSVHAQEQIIMPSISSGNYLLLIHVYLTF